jgi:hypothetical protein
VQLTVVGGGRKECHKGDGRDCAVGSLEMLRD